MVQPSIMTVIELGLGSMAAIRVVETELAVTKTGHEPLGPVRRRLREFGLRRVHNR